MRGAIISNEITVQGSSLHISSTDIDLDQLRAWLLFFDKLDFPSTRIFGFGLSSDLMFLMREGILQRTEAPIRIQGAMEQMFLDGFRYAIEEHEKQEPGIWAIAKGPTTISLVEQDGIPDRALLMQLYDAIPVPAAEVPIEDVLQFRERRSSELQALRYHLEEIFQRIVAAPDKPLAELTEIERFRPSLEDHLKVSKETKFKLKLLDFSAKFDIPTALLAMIGAASVEASPLLIGAAGLAGGKLQIGPSIGPKTARETASPFEYVTKIHNDLMIV